MFECLPQAWPEPQIVWKYNERPLDSRALSEKLQDGKPKYSVRKIAKADMLSTDNNLMKSSANDELHDFSGSRLTVHHVDKRDEGTYSCFVEVKGSHRLIKRESPNATLMAVGKLIRKAI